MNSFCSTILLGVLVTALGSNPHDTSVSAEPSTATRKLPEGPLGETIKLGQELVEKTTTHSLTKPHVGN